MNDAKRWAEHEDRWTRERLEPVLEKGGERRPRFITQSGVEIERVYTPSDVADPANDPDAGRPRSGSEGPGVLRWFEVSDSFVSAGGAEAMDVVAPPFTAPGTDSSPRTA